MPGSDPAAHFLDVPGVRLYYEWQGDGPLLLLIGSPMDSTGFASLARALADDVHRSALALADRLGTPAVEFPGDHGGFVTLPDQCAQLLDQLLTHPT